MVSLTLTIFLRGRYYSHFTDEMNEAQRVTSPTSLTIILGGEERVSQTGIFLQSPCS